MMPIYKSQGKATKTEKSWRGCFFAKYLQKRDRKQPNGSTMKYKSCHNTENQKVRNLGICISGFKMYVLLSRNQSHFSTRRAKRFWAAAGIMSGFSSTDIMSGFFTLNYVSFF